MNTFLVVGLGNPGKEYEKTRHNIGWMALDYIAKKRNIKINKIKFQATYNTETVNDCKVIYLKPQTFMNLSGIAVQKAADYYNVPASKILIIHDDITLPTGKLRIRRQGSAGGHNGLKSIIEALGTNEFPRIKIGVSDRQDDSDLKDWVLGTFSKEDSETIEKRFEKIYNAVYAIIDGNIEKAMADCNKAETE